VVDTYYLLKQDGKVFFVDDTEDDKDELLIKYLVKLEKLKKELSLTKTQLKTITSNKVNEELFLERLLSQAKAYIERLVANFETVENNQHIERDNTKEPICINILLSDWHIGENVNLRHNTYNIDYACARVEMLANKIKDRAEMLSTKYNIDHINVFLLGDMVSGNIHDELKETNDLSDAEQVLWTANLITLFIKDISSICPYINVFGIVGNHGRLRKKKQFKNIHDSFDYLSYHLAKAYTEAIPNLNISWFLPKESEIVVNVFDKWNFYLHHGDNIYAYRNIPYYGIDRMAFKKKSFYISYEDIKLHVFIHGHFHLPSISYSSENHIKIINGTLKGMCEYTINLGEMTDPTQTIFVSSPSKLIEMIDIINLKDATPEVYCRYR